MSTYKNAAQQLSAALDQYLRAAVAELEGKMPAHEAITLARASLHKGVDVAADREMEVRARFDDLINDCFPKREGTV